MNSSFEASKTYLSHIPDSKVFLTGSQLPFSLGQTYKCRETLQCQQVTCITASQHTHTHTYYFKLVKGHKHFSNTLCYFSSLFCQQDMDWNGLRSCHSSLIQFKTINRTFCTIDSVALIVKVSVGATQGLTRVYNLTSYEAALNCKLLDIASRLYPESCRRVNLLFICFCPQPCPSLITQFPLHLCSSATLLGTPDGLVLKANI